MRVLDKYVLRRFLTTFLFAIVAFVLIVIFVDMVGNLGKFIDKSVPTSIIFKYYLFYIPQVVSLILPMSVLLAAMFSLGQLARHDELTAIKSAGVSLNRILLPLFTLSVVMSIAAFVFDDRAVPAASRKKSEIEMQYLDAHKKYSKTRIENLFLRDSLDRRVFIGRFDTGSKIAHRVTIQKYQGNRIVERLDAQTMNWVNGTWVLSNGYRRKFENGREDAERFASLRDESLTFTPEELLEKQADPEYMSSAELNKFIRDVERNGGDPKKWLVSLHFGYAQPFAIFILVLMGSPIAASKNRSGAVFGLIISTMIYLLYFGISRLVQTLGEIGILQPLHAAWLTNAIFLLAGLVLLALMRK